MSLPKLAYLYRRWVREKPARELLTGLGVIVGVALVFATLTANQSTYASSSRIIQALAGDANLQATAISGEGVPEANVPRRIAGARVTTALDGEVTISHDGRAVSTRLVGVSANASETERVPFVGGGVVLPAALASSLGVHAHGQVSVTARGRSTAVRVGVVLGHESIGVLSRSLVAFGYIKRVQQILGEPGRVSVVLAHAQPGQHAALRAVLGRIAGMQVGSPSDENARLRAALRPQTQATSFFVLLGALVGVLLIATATLLTITDRRRLIASLWLQGFTRRQLAAIIMSQAVILGTVASLVGVGVGVLLAGAFGGGPDYLASAFPLGSGTTISIPLAVIVWAGGLAVTCACVGMALLGLRDPASAYRTETGGAMINPRTRRLMLAAAAVLLVASIIASASSSLLSALLLAAVVVLATPGVLGGLTGLTDRGSSVRCLRGLVVAAGSIRAAEIRSIAVAITAGIGLFGAVVAIDVHKDLLSGLEAGYARYVASTPLWITSPGDDLATAPLPASMGARIAGVAGVRGVRPYYGGWVDMRGRRVWLISRSTPSGELPAGQIITGNRDVAEHRLAAGGWVALSDELAKTLGARIGSPVSIPTPAGRRVFRLAATTTNLGWSSGLIFMAPSDYVSAWGATPTAFEVDAPSSGPIQAALGVSVTVQTAGERAAQADALPRQGLQRLSQIAVLLILAASIAIALAMAAMVWQRRPELASLRLQSFRPGQLQALLAWEALLVVGTGVLLGATAGVYGHYAADRYLRVATGYPVRHGLDLAGVLDLTGLVVAITVLILAAPGFRAARAPLRLALDGR